MLTDDPFDAAAMHAAIRLNSDLRVIDPFGQMAANTTIAEIIRLEFDHLARQHNEAMDLLIALNRRQAIVPAQAQVVERWLRENGHALRRA